MAGQRLLVVEDELLVALDIESILSEAGLDVVGPASSAPSSIPPSGRSRRLAAETADGGPAAVVVGTPWRGRGRDGGKRLQRRGAARRRPVETVRFKVDLPNYGVFDEARVRRRARCRAGQFPRRAHRRADLRGHLARGGAGVPGRDRRRDAARAQRLALRARQADVRLQHGGGAGDRDRAAAGLSQPGRRPGRAGLRRRLLRLNADRSSRFRCRPSSPPSGDALAARRRRLAGQGTDRPPLPRARGDLPRLRAGPARLRRQERLSRRGARPVGRHRFGLLRGDGRRCAGARPGALRDDALPLHRRATASRTPRLRRALGVRYDVVPIEPGGRLRRRARAAVRRPRRRHHRGEHPVARPRHDPDGDLQQVRLDGADHRQQVGDVGGLRHALRRHERRLQPDQGRLQDQVYALARWRNAAPRRAASGRRAGDPREHHHQGADSAELRENQTDQDSLPPYDVLDDILEGLVEDEMSVGRDRRPRPRPSHRRARLERTCSTSPNTSAARPRPGCQDHPRGRFRTSAATGRYPITNGVSAARSNRASASTLRRAESAIAWLCSVAIGGR
jgi:NAD+ synthase